MERKNAWLSYDAAQKEKLNELCERYKTSFRNRYKISVSDWSSVEAARYSFINAILY